MNASTTHFDMTTEIMIGSTWDNAPVSLNKITTKDTMGSIISPSVLHQIEWALVHYNLFENKYIMVYNTCSNHQKIVETAVPIPPLSLPDDLNILFFYIIGQENKIKIESETPEEAILNI